MAPLRILSILLLSVGAHCVQMSRAHAQGGGASAPVDVRALSKVRLIGPAGTGEPIRAGVEIALAPNVLTYWRNPGEAGVPPTFDFSGSTNVAGVEVLYPVPARIQEGDISALGYEGQVVFPLRIRPQMPGQPVRLALSLNYATCGKICVPAHASLSLDLPGTPDPESGRLIAEAEAQAPRPLVPAQAARAATLTATPDPDGRAAFLVTPDPALAATDLFVEAPDGFYVTTRAEGSGWRVTVEEHPSDRRAPDTLRLTFAAREPVEFPVTLPK